MKKLLYFDAFNGVSGDMVLGALIHLGLPLEYLKEALAKLELKGYELVAEEIERQGIRGINFRVRLSEPSEHSPHRGFNEIENLIQKGTVDQWVKEKAIAIFRRLGEAEAKVHGLSLEQVHFHEVGAVDSIVDIVGACVGFKYLGVERFYSSPICLGSGTVTFSHGTWPVPTPATAELVADFPVFVGTVRGELTTPTGAAIVTTLVDETTTIPVCIYERSGFGAGDSEFEAIPNMLRLLLGTPQESEVRETVLSAVDFGWKEEELCLLEANIDDMDAEIFGHFMELAFKKGALDVYYAPLHMKKNRPGLMLSVLCRNTERERLAELIFLETTTLGVRWSPWKRWVLDREVKRVETEYGKVGVKIGRFKGKIISIAPEYEDLRVIAERENIPLKELRRKVLERMSNEGNQ
jgi:pyridinium-3,5-bisthiocarboxylic acid mononucleotide nickel chelatase